METQPANSRKNQARTLAVVLALSVVMNIFFLMYAYVMKSEKDKAIQTSEEMYKELEEVRRQAEEQRIIAQEQQVRVTQALQDALKSTQHPKEAVEKK